MRYSVILQVKGLLNDSNSLAEAALRLRNVANELDEMAQDGAILLGTVRDDHAYIVTDDPEVANRHVLIAEKAPMMETDYC